VGWIELLRSTGRCEENTPLTTRMAIEPENSRSPRYIRLPKGGQLCPWTSLTRSRMYDLITPTEEMPSPPVRSVSLKKPGKTRGVRLIDLGSLLEYLDSQDSR